MLVNYSFNWLILVPVKLDKTVVFKSKVTKECGPLIKIKK